MASDDEDDVPHLSAETFAALQDFYVEKEKRQAILDNLEQDDKLKENIVFEENWQLSQFWYDQETIDALVKVVKKVLPPKGTVCLISCPTLYTPIKRAIEIENSVLLMEFDQRFAVHGTDFVHYDFNFPSKIPKEILGTFDLVIADPPFLSEECLTKTSETIKLLAKDQIVLCTGVIMGELAEKLLNVKSCKFKPEHRNNLANEFSCFANFDLDDALR